LFPLEGTRPSCAARASPRYRLTLEAQKWAAASPLPRGEVIRRLGTSATQFYRLMDQTNYSKSMGQLVSLLQILDCEVELVVRARSA
jgi:hypothetical protein